MNRFLFFSIVMVSATVNVQAGERLYRKNPYGKGNLASSLENERIQQHLSSLPLSISQEKEAILAVGSLRRQKTAHRDENKFSGTNSSGTVSSGSSPDIANELSHLFPGEQGPGYLFSRKAIEWSERSYPFFPESQK